MARKARSAPSRGYDPFDPFTTWDVRIARLFYYAFVIASTVIALGIWVTIIAAIDPEIWRLYLELDLGYQIAIVGGIITAHLILIVLFYALFRGGSLRMCRVLYKNRVVAEKYEDHTLLRWLMGVTLLGVYVTVIALIIGLLTQDFVKWWVDTWTWMVENIKNPGIWILLAGIDIMLVILFFFFMFVLWNHGVYLILRQIKKIEEEEEIDEEIKKDKLQKLSEEELQQAYRDDTGRIPMYRGRETKGYQKWKKDHGIK
ncbi:MAG: hypothetical protein GF383_05860 [Candidatus Lokiarchaeota archaeon]|nr:hypothetical protein [Candidatus Lokiarchaeota archaeon]MBD3339457.1 hypothetical protein [Candidatus Lokiarchaeota archaeon]